MDFRMLNSLNMTGLTIKCFLCVESTSGLSADMLQMPDGSVWGNPLCFEEEAVQVHSATITLCTM